MSPQPWDAALEAEVRQSAQHVYEVKVYEAPGSAPGPLIPLSVQSCEVTYDPSWSPYVQGSLVVAMPDQATLAKLDPRKVVTVRVDAGYVRPGGRKDTRPLCTKCYLSRRRANYPDNTLTLEFQGAEYLADAVVAVSQADSPQAGSWSDTTTTGTAIDAALTYTGVKALIGSGATVYDFGADALVGWVPTGDPWVGRAGENSLEVAREVAARNDLWLRADEAGTFRVDYLATLAIGGDPAHSLRVGADGTIVSAGLELSRDGWANEVRVVYTWNVVGTAGSGKDTLTTYRTIGRARVTSGPLSVAAVGRCPIVFERNMPSSQAQADLVAASLLKRYVDRGSTETIDAVAAYWLRPGDAVNLAIPGPESATAKVIRALTYRLHDGAMSLDVATPQPGDIEIQ